MRIVADENIPCVREAFQSWGEIQTLPGFAITPSVIEGADILLVRSVTRVDEALLSGTRVGYVATATSGIDHIDLQYLTSAGIGFCDAPGSNADAVAQYTIVALHAIADRLPRPIPEMSIGIVGVGHVGSRLSRLCEALGMNVVWNDPPRADETSDVRFRPLAEALDCDVVTLHVPLIDEGPYKTRGLIHDSVLDAMRPHAVLVNTCRGDVLDERALARVLDRGGLSACILDVWQHEPEIDAELLEKITLGTPHIAGYSVEGKLRGTQMIHDGLAQKTGIEASWDYRKHLPPAPPPVLVESPMEPGALLSRVYDVRRDDELLRDALGNSGGSGFHELRKTHPPRREFSAFHVQVESGAAAEFDWMARMGFVVEARTI